MASPPPTQEPTQHQTTTHGPARSEDTIAISDDVSKPTSGQEQVQQHAEIPPAPAAAYRGEPSTQDRSMTQTLVPTAEQIPHQQTMLPSPTEGQPIQDPADIAIDADSAYGDDEVSVYTASLTSSVVDFPLENGRRYHAFRKGTYVFPNDEPEQDRMDLHHEMYRRAVSGRLHIAPLPADMKEKRILDLGTGTGIWCVEMADLYPQAEVVGNDFSPVQPSFVPRNLKFEVDDIESPWTHRQPFDYIHSRFLAGAIADWPQLVKRCYDNLAPGAIVEFQDGDFLIYSEDGSTRGTWLERWNTDFAKAATKGGRIVQPGLYLKQWVREAGFGDVYHERIRLPLGVWPKDKQLKEVGAFNLVQLREGLEGFSLALFTRILGWSKDELGVLLSKVREDLNNRNIHAQNDM